MTGPVRRLSGGPCWHHRLGVFSTDGKRTGMLHYLLGRCTCSEIIKRVPELLEAGAEACLCLSTCRQGCSWSSVGLGDPLYSPVTQGVVPVAAPRMRALGSAAWIASELGL